MERIFAQATPPTLPSSAPAKPTGTPTTTPATVPGSAKKPLAPTAPVAPPPAGENASATDQLKNLFKAGNMGQIADDMVVMEQTYAKAKSDYETKKKDFDSKSSYCMAAQWKPKLFSSPCTYIPQELDLSQSISSADLGQVYDAAYTALDKYIEVVQKYIQFYQNEVMNGLNNLPAAQKTQMSATGTATIQAAIAAKTNEWKQYQLDQTNFQRQWKPLFIPINGRTILDCYEEIIELMDSACNTATEYNKILSLTGGSEVPGLGIGPVGPLAMQLISDYEMCARVFTNELTPIYQAISAGGDPKRIARNIQLISVQIPTSFKAASNKLRMAIYEFTLTNKKSSFTAI